MERHYYITTDLDDLEHVEQELEAAGISTPQIHVLSEDHAEVEAHHLHEVDSFTEHDVVHSTEVGAVFGIIGAVLVLVVAWLFGWTETAAGWVPFIFLALVILGFSAWEGGLFGIQVPNVHYKRFQDDLHAGKHVMFVEVTAEQEQTLRDVLAKHPKLTPAGDEHTPPEVALAIAAQNKFNQFKNWGP